MHLSERTAWDREESEYATALTAAKRAHAVLDLTVSNPTRCGFEYDSKDLLSPFASPLSLEYTPTPFGLFAGREAVALYYRDHGATVRPEHLCLTTSTSEAYGFLFQLLCDPGDEVLIARPSYPLFDFLARLHDVRLREYPLHEDPGAMVSGAARLGRELHGAFSIDFHALRSQISERTKAIIVVHPNNPTGNFVADAERAELELICTEHKLALIVDEVFLDYALPDAAARTFAGSTETSSALCFVLSGISKVCALPQMKLSWIAARGPEDLLEDVIARLEIIADTYLSLNAPVQVALPAWLRTRQAIQDQIRNRMQVNLAALDLRLPGTVAGRLALQGGWTAVLRVPRHVEEKPFALACLDRGVAVQPGELYGLPPGRAVLSLLTPPEIWMEGLARLPV